MFKAFTNISSDAAIATRHLLSGVFLLSGFNVCIAAGAFAAGATLHGFSAAAKNFFSVMNYSSVELVSPIPEIIAAFNWTTLTAMGIFGAYSVWLYLSEAAQRTQTPGKVIAFPSRAPSQSGEKIAANG